MPRATNVDSTLPSGPRSQSQIAPSRDTSHSDLRNTTRLPPSGPSASSAGRPRRNEPAFNTNQQLSAPRDRNAMDVDPAPLSRPPPLRINEMPIRANSGMYADREQQINTSTDAAPRGPRAMTIRMSTSSAHPSSPSTSPTSPIYSQRLAGSQERAGNRPLQRSPPHIVANFQMRDSLLPPNQTMPARRASNASERGPPKQGVYQEMESRDQVCLNCFVPRCRC